jgi:hypothetical protein
MPEKATLLCFTCGQAEAQPPRLNRTEDGRVCPTCRDRLLESLPPVLPSTRPAESEIPEPTE